MASSPTTVRITEDGWVIDEDVFDYLWGLYCAELSEQAGELVEL